jgi:hypothetical protein
MDDEENLHPTHTKIQVIHHTSHSDDDQEDNDSIDADDEEEIKMHNILKQ